MDNSNGGRTTAEIRNDGCEPANAFLKSKGAVVASQCLKCPFPEGCIRSEQQRSNRLYNLNIVRNLIGLSNEEIALVANISTRTVQRHRKEIEESHSG